jgi:hypothetical protein
MMKLVAFKTKGITVFLNQTLHSFINPCSALCLNFDRYADLYSKLGSKLELSFIALISTVA